MMAMEKTRLTCRSRTRPRRARTIAALFAGLFVCTVAMAQSNTPQIEERLSTLMACDDENLVKQQLEIRERIADSQLCEVDSDCQLLNPGCPFGCRIGIHKDQAAAITDALTAYREQSRAACGSCTYECPEHDDVKCLDNYCTPVQTR